MTGKDKCKILKEIRRQIAEQNEIEWVVEECRHKGECKGTCPRCESEVRKLERELDIRRRIGKTVALIGISTACLTGLVGCGSLSKTPPIDDLAGAIDVIESTEPVEILDGEIAIEENYDDQNCLPDEPSGEIMQIQEIELSGDVAVDY